MPLDTLADAAESPGLAQELVILFLRIGRGKQGELVGRAVEKHVPNGRRKFPEGRIQAESHMPGEAVHDAAGPGVGLVIEGVFHETSTPNAQRLVGHQKIPVHDHVGSEPETGPARAGRVIELEEVGDQVTHHKVMVRTSKGGMEPFGLTTRPGFSHVDLQELIPEEQRVFQALGQLLFHARPQDEPVHDDLHPQVV